MCPSRCAACLAGDAARVDTETPRELGDSRGAPDSRPVEEGLIRAGRGGSLAHQGAGWGGRHA
jgi:hypothetical protein